MSRWALLLTVLLCIAVIALPAGAHVHLCFDGQEPPASLHLADGGVHHGADLDSPHHDVDVAVDAQSISKLGNLVSQPTALLLSAWLFLLPLPLARSPRPSARRKPLRRPPRFLLPPLRAPPR